MTDVWDPENRLTHNTYDAFNRLITTTPAGISTHYEYDKGGNRTKVTDGASKATQFSYDGLNRLCFTYRDRNTGAEKIEKIIYDGTLEKSRSGGRAQAEILTHCDTLGRAISLTYRKSLENPTTETLSKEYDAWGNVIVTRYWKHGWHQRARHNPAVRQAESRHWRTLSQPLAPLCL